MNRISRSCAMLITVKSDSMINPGIDAGKIMVAESWFLKQGLSGEQAGRYRR